jgi:hypothetical protein
VGKVYGYADESGNLDFVEGSGRSQYFVIGTVALRDLSVGDQLLTLRRNLAWQGIALESCFHASEDAQFVRDEVFRVLAASDFRFDATILEKRKTIPRLQKDRERFYKTAWSSISSMSGPSTSSLHTSTRTRSGWGPTWTPSISGPSSRGGSRR